MDYIIVRAKSQLGWLNLPHFTEFTGGTNVQDTDGLSRHRLSPYVLYYLGYK